VCGPNNLEVSPAKNFVKCLVILHTYESDPEQSLMESSLLVKHSKGDFTEEKEVRNTCGIADMESARF